MQFMLLPLVKSYVTHGSMGNDAALAVMSDKPRMLSTFKQPLRVTNPAIDSIREEVIMALNAAVGPEQNLLEATGTHRLRIPHPICPTRKWLRSNRWTIADGGQRLSTSPSSEHGF